MIWFIISFLIIFVVWTMLVVAGHADEKLEIEYYQKDKRKNY